MAPCTGTGIGIGIGIGITSSDGPNKRGAAKPEYQGSGSSPGRALWAVLKLNTRRL
jgi:hypothetical protein